LKEIKFEYRAHPKQALVHSNPSRFRVLIAGRRGGKTRLAIAEVCFHALLVKNSRIWYIAPTFRQAKTTAWRLFLDMLSPDVIKKKNEQELEIILTNGSEIALKGTERPDLLRGVGLNGVVLDEVAFMKPSTWETVVRPMLTDTQGWALFIGTPAGFGELWKLAKLGDHDKEIEGDPIDILGDEEGSKLKPNNEWQTFRFTTYDNPYVSLSEIQSQKETMNEDYFSQEYLARFTRFTGLVYPEFDLGVHIVTPFDIPLHWTKAIGADVGYTNPSAAEFVAIDEEGNLYIYDEIYIQKHTSSEFIDAIKEKVSGKTYQIKVADPSAADFIARAREAGVWFTAPVKPEGSRQFGLVGETINWVKDYLKPKPTDGKPGLYVFNNCKNLIREFQTYVWDDKKFNSEDRRPKKENDHTMDAIRYAIMEVRGRKSAYQQYDVYGQPQRLKTDVEDKDWDVSR
jgi:hypothetical protein